MNGASGLRKANVARQGGGGGSEPRRGTGGRASPARLRAPRAHGPGAIRRLPSGRFLARYPAPDGRRLLNPATKTQRDILAALHLTENDLKDYASQR